MTDCKTLETHPPLALTSYIMSMQAKAEHLIKWLADTIDDTSHLSFPRNDKDLRDPHRSGLACSLWQVYMHLLPQDKRRYMELLPPKMGISSLMPHWKYKLLRTPETLTIVNYVCIFYKTLNLLLLIIKLWLEALDYASWFYSWSGYHLLF